MFILHPRRRKQAFLALLPALLGLITLQLPPPTNLQNLPLASPLILDRNGDELVDFPRPDFFRHLPTTYADIPDHLVKATLAAEDKRFFSHPGIDYTAIARATYYNSSKKHITSGASTITQQLVKISSPPRSRNYLTKIKESYTARQIETRWGKKQILTAYLNRLDYGNHQQGCSAAAHHFFNKPLSDLSLAESALLAALPQAPSRLNPFRNPEAALSRRNWILDRLQNEFSYQPELISRAKSEPLQLSSHKKENPIPHLNLTSHGDAPIHSSIDSHLQKKTKHIIAQELAHLTSKNVQHAALVVIHNPTGEILAYHGSRHFSDANGGQINGAITPRSAGSTLKPFTYYLAFRDRGLYPGSVIADIPTKYRTAEGLDLPKNYDRRHHGPVTIRHALANSLNVAAMRTLNHIGGPEPLHQVLQELGLTTLPKDPTELGLGLTIGNAHVSLLELSNAYATLARSGQYLPTTFHSQKTTPTYQPRTILNPEESHLISHILSDNAARSQAFGSRSYLRLPFNCAVKTGTSSDFRDNWCLGYTNDFTVGVWVGNFDNSPMAGISGITGAAPIFHHTMLLLHKKNTPTFPSPPPGLTKILIDPRTGHRATSYTSKDLTKIHLSTELCRIENLPQVITSHDYSPSGQAYLSSIYQEWFRSQDQRHSHHFTLRPQKKPSHTASLPRIISPLDQSIYYLDPELPTNTHHLKLLTNLPTHFSWSSPTLLIENNNAQLTPGTHRITLTHQLSGKKTIHQISVEKL